LVGVAELNARVRAPDEIVGPVLVREPSYRVEVALARQTIRAYGVELPLEPDLELQADIVAERRSLLSWLLDPVLSVWRRS
jgi:membrane fusion protein